jgi:transcription elongation GreA/GreB family factor
MMEKRSVLGHIIKIYPDLEKLMVAKQQDKEEEKKSRGPVTSIRAFRERQLMLEKIQKVDIPQNSKDIGHAREYGDLRENFEFKAAKEMQGILMRRQGELQQMLSLVVPSELENMPTEKAGIGTGVRIAYSDGREERYYILGVWDRDEVLGIISCESKLAQALEGHVAGDEVTIPTEHGEAQVRLVSVEGLSDAVRAWLRDIPETIEGLESTN